jgi:hypothetical protein
MMQKAVIHHGSISGEVSTAQETRRIPDARGRGGASVLTLGILTLFSVAACGSGALDEEDKVTDLKMWGPAGSVADASASNDDAELATTAQGLSSARCVQVYPRDCSLGDNDRSRCTQLGCSFVEIPGQLVCYGEPAGCAAYSTANACHLGECRWAECTKSSECGAGEVCYDNRCERLRSDGEACPADVLCENSCIFGVCGPRRDYGGGCDSNPDCIASRCDVGIFTTNTRKCIPNDRTGDRDDYCTHDNHCASPNSCIAKRCAPRVGYGESCDSNRDCSSSRCDVGTFTTNTRKCIPNDGQGKDKAYCTHNNHCDSRLGLLCRLESGKNYGRCG